MKLADVRGLTPRVQCRRLGDYAAQVPADQAVVEIGVYRGRSLAYMASRTEVPCFGIDPWGMPVPDGYTGSRRRLERHINDNNRDAAQEAVRRLGLHNVELIQGFSTEVAHTWKGPAVGLLHIDGDHHEQSVMDDVFAWWPHLSPQAVVAFDDYEFSKFPGVMRAVHRFLDAGMLTLEEVFNNRLAITRVSAQ